MAVLKGTGTEPEDRELFTMERMWGLTVGKISFRSLVGMGSRGQEVDFMWAIVSWRVERDISLNEQKEGLGEPEATSGLGTEGGGDCETSS